MGERRRIRRPVEQTVAVAVDIGEICDKRPEDLARALPAHAEVDGLGRDAET